VDCSSVALAPDYDLRAASVMLSSFSASLSASLYSFISHIRLPLEPDLALYKDLILLIQEVFTLKSGTLLAIEYHVQKPRLI